MRGPDLLSRPAPLGVSLCLTVLWACSDSTGPGQQVATPTSITVTPTSTALSALGATQQLTATVMDQDGQPMAGAAVVWTSADEAVATVSEGGLITAVAEGVTTVTAASGTLSADVAVTVSQEPADVVVTPGSSELLPGATVDLTAAVMDANGHAVADPPAVAWSTTDEAVATVDAATGVVTAVAEGSVTITATSGSASGTAAITVLAPPPDLSFDADGTLGGTVNAGSFTIRPGVTVTLTEDLVLSTTGPVLIEGSLVGDCMAIDGFIGGDLTLNGATLDTSCGVLPPVDEAPGLTLEAVGVLTMESSQVTSAGDVLISNDPNFVPEEDGFSPPAAAATGSSFGGRRPLLPAGARERVAMTEEAPNCFIEGVTIDVETTAPPSAGSEVARPIFLPGSVSVGCRGDLVAADLTVQARDGADGESVSVAAPSPSVKASDGLPGGWALLHTEGQATIAGVVQLLGGAGGNGGKAIAVATAPGGAASAEAGDGGFGMWGGVVASSIEIPPGGELIIGFGRDGDGGAAGAQGGNGDPGQAGGDATALAGSAGWGADAFWLGDFVHLGTTGGLFILKGSLDPDSRSRVRILPLVAGNGGEGEAVAGRGGDGPSPGAPGAPGGNATSAGGKGGDLRVVLEAPLTMPIPFTLGDGGNATWRNGRGGNGASDFCSPGGMGGMGGDAMKGAGAAGRPLRPLGFDITEGSPGVGTLDAFGNGGDGADGTGGGDAGPGGSNGTEAPMGGVPPDPTGSFQPGDPGSDLPCSASTLMDLIWETLSDPNGHRAFVNFQSVAQAILVFQAQELLLTLQESGVLFGLTGAVTAPSGAPAGPAGAIMPGTYTFSLSGTGTAAGFPGVLVVFDGSIEVDAQGKILSLTGEMTVDANNDTFPPNEAGERHPLVYGVTGTPAADGSGGS